MHPLMISLTAYPHAAATGRILDLLLRAVSVFWLHPGLIRGHGFSVVQCVLASPHHLGHCLNIHIGAHGFRASWSG